MKKITHIAILILTLQHFSCEITEVNVDPDNPATVNASVVYPGMITQTHRNLVALNGRIAGIVIQHFDGLDAQQAQYAQYNIGESDIDDAWDFGLYGAGTLTDCDYIIKNFSGEVSALAKLYMAANLGFATCTWGDIPYTEAFEAQSTGNLTPVYDSQEDIYNTIQTLLDEALADGVGNGIGGTIIGNVNWDETAHALKARYYLHLTSVDPSAAQNALTEAQQALSEVSNQPDFTFSLPAQNSNPLYLFEFDRPSTLGFGTTLNNMMTGDPRLSLYTSNGEDFTDGDLFWGQPNSPTPLISYWEVKFIEAEALVRTNGSDTDALTALQDAVTANMNYMGISDPSSYVNALTLTGTTEQKIEIIITEKYKALYGNAPIEAWVDYRRTGYPALTPSPDAVPSLNPSLVIPRRFLYPITERLNNEANYTSAISAQGGHLLDDDLWAFPSN
ncbi:SusD/RagB family nutrient-binding outer membrane lipoprotein [Winogradskyella sp.]|uniref:SusD/RagB family nutrient-binding outer membrane lipoprotein n=1 Tax=Winogradskyella sp. TaxID=1883156 RepID=UPI003BAA76BC